MLRDILILKIFVKNIDLSQVDQLKNIVIKCKALIVNPKENFLISKMLLRNVYLNILKSLENPNFYNDTTKNQYDEIIKATYFIFDQLIDKYIGFSK